MNSKDNGIDKNLLFTRTIHKWGYEFQILMVLEEMSELQKALIKFIRSKDERLFNELKTNIAEEIADVEIMLEQLRFIINKNNYIEQTKRIKLIRLRNRLDSSKTKCNHEILIKKPNFTNCICKLCGMPVDCKTKKEILT